MPEDDDVSFGPDIDQVDFDDPELQPEPEPEPEPEPAPEPAPVVKPEPAPAQRPYVPRSGLVGNVLASMKGDLDEVGLGDENTMRVLEKFGEGLVQASAAQSATLSDAAYHGARELGVSQDVLREYEGDIRNAMPDVHEGIRHTKEGFKQALAISIGRRVAACETPDEIAAELERGRVALGAPKPAALPARREIQPLPSAERMTTSRVSGATGGGAPSGSAHRSTAQMALDKFAGGINDSEWDGYRSEREQLMENARG